MSKLIKNDLANGVIPMNLAQPEGASSCNNELVSVDSFNSDKRDAERYRYIRRHMEWRRSGGTGLDEDSHAFVGCRFPYYGNFECASMLDENIDKMIKREH